MSNRLELSDVFLPGCDHRSIGTQQEEEEGVWEGGNGHWNVGNPRMKRTKENRQPDCPDNVMDQQTGTNKLILFIKQIMESVTTNPLVWIIVERLEQPSAAKVVKDGFINIHMNIYTTYRK